MSTVSVNGEQTKLMIDSFARKKKGVSKTITVAHQCFELAYGVCMCVCVRMYVYAYVFNVLVFLFFFVMMSMCSRVPCRVPYIYINIMMYVNVMHVYVCPYDICKRDVFIHVCMYVCMYICMYT